MKRTILLPFFIIIFYMKSYGQGFDGLPMHEIYKDFYNPAFTAYSGKPSFYALGGYHYTTYRDQKALKDPPNQYYILGMSTPLFIKGKQKLGIGLNYSRQHYYMTDIDDAKINIAYQQSIAGGTLVLGMNADIMKHHTNSQFVPPSILKNPTTTLYTAGLGIGYYYQPSNFYLGFSVDRLDGDKFINNGPMGNYYFYHQTCQLMSGIDFRSGKRLTITPSIRFFDLQNSLHCIPDVSATWKDRYKAGIFFNTPLNQPGIRIGYKTKHLSVHYAYGLPYYDLGVAPGFHTLALTLELKGRDNEAGAFNRILPTGS